jgi:hypothetical protein
MVVSVPTQVTFSSNIVVDYEVWTSPGEVTTENTPALIIAASTMSISTVLAATGGSTGRWVRPVTFHVSSGVISQGSYGIDVIVSNASTLTFTPANGTLGGLVVTGLGVRSFVPLVYAAEFANSQLPWFSTRTTATAALFTNVTQVLNKGGTVLCGRVSPQVLSPWAVTSSYVNNLHPAEKAFLPYETGAYTYCPPSTDMASFYDYTVPVSGPLTSQAPVYRLDNDSLVNHLFFSAPALTGETLAVTVDWHVEFRTSSALFPIGLSTVTLEAFHQAQISLAAAGFFFENPEHKSVLSRVTSAVRKYGPTVASAIHPMAGAAVRAGTLMLDSKPRNKMKTTSADSSGITKPKPPPKSKNNKPPAKKQGKRR